MAQIQLILRVVNIPVVQQVSVEIPQVQFLDKVEICPLLRRQVQFSWWSWVVDMPVYVQRQVLSFYPNFHNFYVNVDSVPEAASMEFHGSSHLKI